MTAFYGSEAVPKEVFGEGKMLAAFFATLEEETPFVWELNKAFLSLWNPKALKYSWVLPDNFHVHVKVMDQVQETVQFMGENFVTSRTENLPMTHGRSLGANVTHSIDGLIVRELLRRCDYNREQIKELKSLLKSESGRFDPEKQTKKTLMVTQLWDLYVKSGYLSARIIDYLDESTLHLVDVETIVKLIESFPEKPFQIIPVHDCFRCHPNHANDLRRQYNLQLSLIAQSDMLQFLLAQVVGQPVVIHKQGNFAADVLNADYALS